MAKLKKYIWFVVIKNDDICVAKTGAVLLAKTKRKLELLCDNMEQIEKIRKINICLWTNA